ncbi:hypothetical protein SAMN06264365_110222 [Actinoplanes regularis]|uniref:Uncharacterized protein n=1 Tax=Actinoplanes regularis TaxID=52697 RepID=A0A239BZM3_9ACTN|nr:hypothetical protein SAMN06264365_110222 [Actinoplanes regularis]
MGRPAGVRELGSERGPQPVDRCYAVDSGAGCPAANANSAAR